MIKFKVNFQNSIQLGDNIYIDPYQLKEEGKAKYIFITHPHYDHLSWEDIKKILLPTTKIIIPKSSFSEMPKEIDKNQMIMMDANETIKLDDLEIQAVPAYNISKKFHPKENHWLGYIITIDKESYYIVGDSDKTEELSHIKCDYLFIPVGGTYTMDYKEAALLTNQIKPKLVIPTHYGPIIPGSFQNAEKFVSLLDETINYKIFF